MERSLLRRELYSISYNIVLLLRGTQLAAEGTQRIVILYMKLMYTIIVILYTQLSINQFYCSICLPKNPDAESANFISTSPILTLGSVENIITEPIASPSAIIGEIT